MLSKGVKSGSDLFQSLVNLRGRLLPSELRCCYCLSPNNTEKEKLFDSVVVSVPLPISNLKSLRLYIFQQSHQLSMLYTLEGKLHGKDIFLIILHDMSSY